MKSQFFSTGLWKKIKSTPSPHAKQGSHHIDALKLFGDSNRRINGGFRADSFIMPEVKVNAIEQKIS